MISSGVSNAVNLLAMPDPCCLMSARVLQGLIGGGRGGGGQQVDKGLPCHVNLVLEEDVVKSCLQVLLVLNVSLVVGAIHLHDPHQS